MKTCTKCGKPEGKVSIRGSTGIRPVAPGHSALLGDAFVRLLERTPLPEDQRYVPCTAPLLLGAIPDRLLSELSGVSREMVAWYRRKRGILLNRRGERTDASNGIEHQ